MANIISSIISNVKPGDKRFPSSQPKVVIALVDGEPTISDGVDLPIGSVCTWDNNGIGRIYFKTGNTATDWTLWVTEPNPRHENLPFIGSGVGASKTTTVRDGSVIAEQMGVGDELFIMWHFPLDLDKTVPVHIEVEWYLNATETGKLISGEIEITFVNGELINVITDTLNLTDEVVPTPAYASKQTLFELDLSTYPEATNAESLHVVFRRVASSDDPTAHPRLHHISVEYTPLYPSLA